MKRKNLILKSLLLASLLISSVSFAYIYRASTWFRTDEQGKPHYVWALSDRHYEGPNEPQAQALMKMAGNAYYILESYQKTGDSTVDSFRWQTDAPNTMKFLKRNIQQNRVCFADIRLPIIASLYGAVDMAKMLQLLHVTKKRFDAYAKEEGNLALKDFYGTELENFQCWLDDLDTFMRADLKDYKQESITLKDCSNQRCSLLRLLDDGWSVEIEAFHALRQASDEEKVVVCAGGSHVEIIESKLPMLGYVKVGEVGMSEEVADEQIKKYKENSGKKEVDFIPPLLVAQLACFFDRDFLGVIPRLSDPKSSKDISVSTLSLALRRAVICNDVSLINRLLRAGARVDLVGSSGMTSIMIAQSPYVKKVLEENFLCWLAPSIYGKGPVYCQKVQPSRASLCVTAEIRSQSPSSQQALSSSRGSLPLVASPARRSVKRKPTEGDEVEQESEQRAESREKIDTNKSGFR